MKAKFYSIAGEEYQQGVLSVDQIKAFLKLLKELGVGQIINAGQLNFDVLFDQIIEHDKVELFMATVLIPRGQIFNKQNYDENLQRFGGCSGELLAEVIEDFLSFNEPWFTRLGGMMDRMNRMNEELPMTINTGKSIISVS